MYIDKAIRLLTFAGKQHHVKQRKGIQKGRSNKLKHAVEKKKNI